MLTSLLAPQKKAHLECNSHSKQWLLSPISARQGIQPMDVSIRPSLPGRTTTLKIAHELFLRLLSIEISWFDLLWKKMTWSCTKLDRENSARHPSSKNFGGVQRLQRHQCCEWSLMPPKIRNQVAELRYCWNFGKTTGWRLAEEATVLSLQRFGGIQKHPKTLQHTFNCFQNRQHGLLVWNLPGLQVWQSTVVNTRLNGNDLWMSIRLLRVPLNHSPFMLKALVQPWEYSAWTTWSKSRKDKGKIHTSFFLPSLLLLILLFLPPASAAQRAPTKSEQKPESSCLSWL